MGENGFVYIINNMDFSHHSQRKGSEVDVKTLQSFFVDTVYWGDNFNVDDNLTVEEMKTKLKNIGRWDFSKNGAFFLIILSHGSEYGVCGTDSNPNNPENVLNVEQHILPLFTNTNCPSLCEKPKVLIMQACRGDMDDDGFCVETDAVMTHPPVHFTRHIPNTSEYLLCYPCAPGYTSTRNTGYGSTFIRSLVYIFKEKYKDEDISRMLLRVNYNVAHQNNSLRIKQMPSHDNRLTRLTYFQRFFTKKKRLFEEKGII